MILETILNLRTDKTLRPIRPEYLGNLSKQHDNLIVAPELWFPDEAANAVKRGANTRGKQKEALGLIKSKFPLV